ncbi:hypothetical protein ACQRAV_04760 [Segatella copri]|uniref:hypothetical protein n=1 Tax=Segatella copri TaxID=165179 RepID=UPI003D08EA2C
MKKIKTYIGIMAALLTMLTACSDSMVDNGVPSKNETGTYQAHFTISVPNYSKVESRVANFATEGIADAADMQLLCFDKDGYFLGLAKNLNIQSVAIKPDGGSDKKNISATIPTGTARIHIMANATAENTVTTGNQSIDFKKSAEWIGRHENNLMTSFDNKNNNQQHDKMVYWGYVTKKTPEEMTEFLTKDVVANNVIHLLRNRAKIEVNWDDNTSEIENIRYALGNVMQHGTVAPFNREKLTFPETNMLNNAAAWKAECTYITPSLDPTRWPSEGEKFSVKDEEMWSNSSSLPMQYTFEQENSLEKPLKVIMEVTYKGRETKWFQVLLQNEGVQIPVKRNHLYRINIKKLGKNLGYSSAELAYNGDPANNPWITVADIIQEISDGTYTMNIVNGTYQMLTQESANSDQVIDFEYTGEPNQTAADFDVSWTENKNFTKLEDGKLPEPTVQYDATTGKGTITYKIGDISAGECKTATIMLVDKNHGLTRNIHLYSIWDVDFKFPKEITMGKKVTSEAQLTFKIPSYYPKELLPIEIEIASNDVNPIGSDVKVASTEEVDGGKGWNCWFVTKYEDPNVIGNTQTITMKNVRAVPSSTNTGTFYIKAKHYYGNNPWTVTINYQNQN